MKRISYPIILVLIISLLIPTSLVSAADNGVDDLRGRWDLELIFNQDGFHLSPIAYITNVRLSTEVPGRYFASGCVRSPDTDAFMPLSMRADYSIDTNSYEIFLLSTIVPPEPYGPYVFRLIGEIGIGESGLKDDAASGTLKTSFDQGSWTATHHDRRETKCPAVNGTDFGVQGDVYAAEDLTNGRSTYYSQFGADTIIVSSGMLVEVPDGTSFIMPQYTDVYSPDVDFIGRFRYSINFPGAPISGEPYKFVLLDALGEPIPGTESTDIWYDCAQDAPQNLIVENAFPGEVNLTWQAVADVPGQFEPGADPQIGFYQIDISTIGDMESYQIYGSNWISSLRHVIPSAGLVPGQTGTPDGFDFGVPLQDFPDGRFRLDLGAYSFSPVSEGYGLECQVYDPSARLIITKLGNDFQFEQTATISGRVVDGENNPLEGLDVNACDFNTPEGGFCTGARTDAEGDYLLFVPAGGYRVWVNESPGWSWEFYFNTRSWDEASEVFAFSGQETAGIDFSLQQVGNISGTIYDEQGNPLGGIAVDTEMGGYGTCSDENGQYTLQGIPLGNVNVVAGRDFCGEHPYAEQSMEVAVGSTGVDFYLPLRPPDNNLTIVTQPDHGWVESSGWVVGTEVTLYIDDNLDPLDGFLSTLNQTAVPAEWNPEIATASFNGFEPGLLLPGRYVIVTDGSLTDSLLIETISITSFDPEAGLVTGQAPAGREMGIGMVDPYGFYWLVISTGSGSWSYDCSGNGAVLAEVFNMWVMIWDADGDATQANYNFP
jgi:hypothetical protein